jgi:hypothetical protein
LIFHYYLITCMVSYLSGKKKNSCLYKLNTCNLYIKRHQNTLHIEVLRGFWDCKQIVKMCLEFSCFIAATLYWAYMYCMLLYVCVCIWNFCNLLVLLVETDLWLCVQSRRMKVKTRLLLLMYWLYEMFLWQHKLFHNSIRWLWLCMTLLAHCQTWSGCSGNWKWTCEWAGNGFA